MDTQTRNKIKAARRKRERGQAMADEGTRELAAALAEARRSTSRPYPTQEELLELAGLDTRQTVHALIRWHERGAEGSPWSRRRGTA